MTTTASGTTTTTHDRPKDGGYIVLSEDSAGLWKPSGTFDTKSAGAAVRKYAEKNQIGATLTLVAIPVRSFRPVKVTAKTTTTLVVEDVKQ